MMVSDFYVSPRRIHKFQLEEWTMKIIRAVIACLACPPILLLSLATAQTVPNQAVPGQALPSDDEIRQVLVDRIDVQHKSVGMVVGIITPQGRRLITYGRLNQGDPRRLDGDTVFEIGSVTKVFTALLLSDMVQRGEVHLDDPVAKYLPSSSPRPDANGHTITLVDLATQTSGLPFFPSDVPLNDLPKALEVVAAYTPERVYQFLSTWQPTRPIGSKWEYSNLGFGVLGLALSSRAGTGYESLVRARITGPLAMESTGITVPPAMYPQLAIGHGADLQPAPPVNMPAFLGAGCLRSSASDMLTFLAAFMGYNKSSLALAMAAMLETRRPGPSFQQALGWWIISMGEGDPGFVLYGGETPGFSSTFAYDPKSRVGVVVLSNGAGGDGGLGAHLMRPALPVETAAAQKARAERKEIAFDRKWVDLYSGQYKINAGPAAGMVITIECQGANLILKDVATPPEGLRLHAEDARTFFTTTPDLDVVFQSDDNGRTTSLTIRFAGTATVAPRITSSGR